MNEMNITSAQYGAVDGENTCIVAVINGKDCVVPLAADNSEYQAILAWVAEGNTIADAD